MATTAKSATKKSQEKTFLWQGTDKKGKKIKGETIASNDALVRAMLRKQGITPTKVSVQSALFKPRKKKITSSDIAIFARQLATMMKAGVPLVQALQLVSQGHENPSVRELVGTVKNDIEAGGTLAEALARHPMHFDDLFVNLVEAGEKSGTLEALLDKVALYKEKTEALKAKVKKAMFYPTAVICVAFIVSGILLIFVVPTFQELFQSFGADLPAFTLFVIGLSEFLQKWIWAVLIGIGATVFTFVQAHKRSRKFRRLLHRIQLKLPIVGDIFYKSAVARYARTLSTMFAAGVPLVEALESVAKAAGNIVFEEAIFEIREQVATGLQLTLSMSQAGIFPNMAVQMVAIGEESGALDDMCAKVADYYEDEVDNLVDALSSLLEPLIMAVLGVMVGGLVIAMYLPIFKLGAVV